MTKWQASPRRRQRDRARPDAGDRSRPQQLFPDDGEHESRSSPRRRPWGRPRPVGLGARHAPRIPRVATSSPSRRVSRRRVRVAAGADRAVCGEPSDRSGSVQWRPTARTAITDPSADARRQMASGVARARVTTPGPRPRRLATLTHPTGRGRLDRTRCAAAIVGRRVVHGQHQERGPECKKPRGEIEEQRLLGDARNRQRATRC
jgi:hypothetical protein